MALVPAIVAVRDVVGLEVVGRFQGHSYVPDPYDGVAYLEDHIAWTDLRQIIQLTAGVGLVAEDAGTNHAREAAAECFSNLWRFW